MTCAHWLSLHILVDKDCKDDFWESSPKISFRVLHKPVEILEKSFFSRLQVSFRGLFSRSLFTYLGLFWHVHIHSLFALWVLLLTAGGLFSCSLFRSLPLIWVSLDMYTYIHSLPEESFFSRLQVSFLGLFSRSLFTYLGLCGHVHIHSLFAWWVLLRTATSIWLEAYRNWLLSEKKCLKKIVWKQFLFSYRDWL